MIKYLAGYVRDPYKYIEVGRWSKNLGPRFGFCSQLESGPDVAAI